jgi:hypothetical protein
VAFPKRGATTYPALLALAGVATALLLGELRRVLGRAVPIVAAVIGTAVFLGYAATASYQWFSGVWYPAGRPEALALAETAGRQITPGTILIIDGYDYGTIGRLSFLLLPFLLDPARQPSVATHLSLIERPFQEAAQSPASIIGWVGHTYPYGWTDLWTLLPSIQAHRDWRTVVFAFQVHSYHDEHRPIVEHFHEALARCPDAVTSSFEATDRVYDFEFVSCSLRSWRTGPVIPASRQDTRS